MPAPSGLPARLSSFVGRKKELAELRRLLPHTRLLTLLGPGGSGKTRLATEFVRQHVARHSEGAVFAELGETGDGALVPEAIARAANIKLEGSDPLAGLARQLQTRRLLLIDNCEHLVEAAALVVTRLLVECPRLSVLATSRERLKVEGEVVWHVPPLGATAVANADASDAVRLFVDRARSVRPGFLIDSTNADEVLAICRRVDGMPLAIELAAARMTTLSPRDIVQRLEDSLALLTGGSRNAVDRQHTLRATIDWSYNLLDLDEQRLLQRMAVFAGSAEAAAVEEVCAFPPLERNAVLDSLTRLVEKSMVQVDAGSERTTTRLLETIREYALEKLRAEGHEKPARDRHLGRYRRLIEEASAARRHRGATAEHRRLWREMNDVRAALEWARGDVEVELEMLGGLYLVWLANAPTEGFERLSELLLRVEPHDSPGFLSAAHAWNAVAGLTGRRAEVLLPLDQFVTLALGSQDRYFAGLTHMGMGYSAERWGGDPEDAHQSMARAVATFEELGPGPNLAMALGSLGSMELAAGRMDAARRHIDRALTTALAIDDLYGAVGAYFHLGQLELEVGNYEASRAAFLAGLKLVEPGDTLSTTDQVAGIGCTFARDDPALALRLVGAAARLRAEVALPIAATWVPRMEAALEQARSSLPEPEAESAWRSLDGLTLEAIVAEVIAKLEPPSRRAQGAAHGLSPREFEIAELVAAGMTSRALAEKLFLSERTVETHLNHIMTKLGFSARTQVAAWIVEQRQGSSSGA